MKHTEVIETMSLPQKAAFLTGKGMWHTVCLPDQNVPSVAFADGPHGLRVQTRAEDHLGLNQSLPSTCFPTASAMANSFDPDLGGSLGRALGEEAASMNVSVVLGPGVNMKRDPLCGRNFEYFSEDPYLAGKMAAGYVRGIQRNGVAACVKHFAANNQEHRRMVIDSVVDARTLRENYLTAFEIAVKEGGARALMTSYNKVNGVFACEHPYLLRRVLREEWGFDGVTVTDWGGCNDRVESVRCGNDLEMPRCRYGADDLVEAVESGRLLESALDECVDRLLELVERYAPRLTPPFDRAAHHALARRCAAECAVLLENDGILPLETGTRCALIGDFAFEPRYQGAGSSLVNPTRLTQAVAAATGTRLSVTGCERGFHRFGKRRRRLERRAMKLAARADVVLFFAGLDEVSEAEGLDRADMRVPGNQTALCKKLIEAGHRVVVVLSCGGPVELDWTAGAAAVLYAGLNGQAGAEAVFDLLTGAAAPSGKLSETWPLQYEDCPAAGNFPGRETSAEYREGPFIGYRYYSTAGVPVRYPFGHGLSYTTFAYSDLTLDDNGAAFTVANTGAVAAAEVAQLYVGKPDSPLIRPVRELKGFAKVFLRPGEHKIVRIPFDDYTFRYFDIATDRFEVEGGAYRIEIGASSRDIRLTGTKHIEGTAPPPYTADVFPTYRTGRVKEVPDEEFGRLLGHRPPPACRPFYKKGRLPVDENSTVLELRYAPGIAGRLLSAGLRLVAAWMRLFGSRATSATVAMGLLHQPLRGLAKYADMTRRKLEGLILMCNGRLFRGLKLYLTGGKKRRKR